MIRFYLDECLSYEVALAARREGLDVTSSGEIGRNGTSDEDQLRYAAQEGRCLLTADCKDFGPLSIRLADVGLPHAGVLCLTRPIKRREIPAVVRALVRVTEENPQGLPAYAMIYI